MHINIHTSESRGSANFGWLNSRHTYSFSSYRDPSRMGLGKLRVINDDIVQPSKGFGLHPHENMEIISIPLRGALRHSDSMGNEQVIRAGEVQIMSAGTGIMHSEYNHSDSEEVNFLQIWIMPQQLNIEPRYEQREFSADARRGTLQLVLSPSGADGSMQINQDAFLSLASVEAGQTLPYVMRAASNGVYLFVISGEVKVDGSTLSHRDGAELTDAADFDVVAGSDSELLFIEVPV